MTDRKDEQGQPINRVRRRDRAVEDESWIRAYLREAPYGVLATECDGQPFITPLVFAYDKDDSALYFHTGRGGRLLANVQRNPRVCFSVSSMGSPRAAGKACGFSVDYESVVVFGRAKVLDDEQEAIRGLRLMLDKYFPDLSYGEDYAGITPEGLAATAVYRVAIDSWSGKRNLPDMR
jgi:nitroimidazol reductase NimA-like FMN-containing flavoprotein (pyridoxamine 5'-phosphate oxidase superfamily)